MIRETLAELLRLVNTTKRDFARRIGFSPAYITLLLNGEKKNPSDRFYQAVSNAYAVSEEWLRTGRGAVFRNEPAQSQISDAALLEKYRHLSPRHQAIISELIDAMILKYQQ